MRTTPTYIAAYGALRGYLGDRMRLYYGQKSLVPVETYKIGGYTLWAGPGHRSPMPYVTPTPDGRVVVTILRAIEHCAQVIDDTEKSSGYERVKMASANHNPLYIYIPVDKDPKGNGWTKVPSGDWLKHTGPKGYRESESTPILY